MKKIFKLLIWTILSLVLLCVFIFFISWKSPKYYTITNNFDSLTDSIIPFKNYEQIIDHPRPYLIKSPGKYFIIGCSHTRDPNSPEIVLMKAEWKKLQPTVALVEGRLGFLLPGFMNAVETLGEGGQVKSLAQKDNIPIYNWDLPKEKLAAQLLKKFNAEQIALAQILNPYFSELRFGKPASPEDFIKQYIKRAAYVGQESNFKTPADVDRIWKKYFTTGEDWRNIDDQNGLPGYLDEMAAFTNDLRNEQLVAAIKELLAKGEKVFVCCGSSHAACIAPSFINEVSK